MRLSKLQLTLLLGSTPAANVFDISIMEMTFYEHFSSEVDVKHIKLIM